MDDDQKQPKALPFTPIEDSNTNKAAYQLPDAQDTQKAAVSELYDNDDYGSPILAKHRFFLYIFLAMMMLAGFFVGFVLFRNEIL